MCLYTFICTSGLEANPQSDTLWRVYFHFFSARSDLSERVEALSAALRLIPACAPLWIELITAQTATSAAAGADQTADAITLTGWTHTLEAIQLVLAIPVSPPGSSLPDSSDAVPVATNADQHSVTMAAADRSRVLMTLVHHSVSLHSRIICHPLEVISLIAPVCCTLGPLAALSWHACSGRTAAARAHCHRPSRLNLLR